MLPRISQTILITLGLYLLVSLNALAVSRSSTVPGGEDPTLTAPASSMVAKVRSQLAP